MVGGERADSATKGGEERSKNLELSGRFWCCATSNGPRRHRLDSTAVAVDRGLPGSTCLPRLKTRTRHHHSRLSVCSRVPNCLPSWVRIVESRSSILISSGPRGESLPLRNRHRGPYARYGMRPQRPGLRPRLPCLRSRGSLILLQNPGPTIPKSEVHRERRCPSPSPAPQVEGRGARGRSCFPKTEPLTLTARLSGLNRLARCRSRHTDLE